MNYGRFFSLDYESSLFHKGMAVYYYREVKDRDRDNDNPLSSRFPIYMTISKQSIDFRVHYYSNKGEEGQHTHLHNEILSLPISTNLEIRDRLTEVLAEAYDTNFPNNSEGSGDSCSNPNRNYLYYLVVQLGDQIKQRDGREIPFYYNLDVFRNQQEPKKDELSWFLRKLILDFIFDLEHTRIFQTHPDYEYIYIRLKENFFFEALVDKAGFYYYRELIKGRFEENNKEKQNRSNESIYFEQLLEAELAWTKKIRNLIFDETFMVSGGWFQYPEKEMNEVYLSRSDDESSGYRNLASVDISSKKKLRNSSVLSSKWYARRFAFQNIFAHIWSISYNGVFVYVFSIFLIGGLINFPEVKTIQQFYFLTLIYLFILSIYSNYVNKTYFLELHVFIPRVMIAIVAGWVTIFLGTTMLGLNSVDVEETKFTLLLKKDYVYYILLLGIFFNIFSYVFLQIGKFSPNLEYGINNYRVSRYHYRYIFKRGKRSLYFCLIAFLYSYLIANGFTMLFKNKVFLEPLERTYMLYTFFAMFIGIFIQLTFEEKPMTDDL